MGARSNIKKKLSIFCARFLFLLAKVFNLINIYDKMGYLFKRMNIYSEMSSLFNQVDKFTRAINHHCLAFC